MQPHPAPFSQPILDRLRELLAGEGKVRVLDPFAGTGRVLAALPPGSKATLIEIEQAFVDEGHTWIAANRSAFPGVDYLFHCADSSSWLGRTRKTFTHIITSPTYGNRMSDGYRSKPGTQCRSYAQSKGGALHPRNTGAYKLDSDAYSEINYDVMLAAVERLVLGGKVMLNVSDFYRTPTKGAPPQRQPVGADWVNLMTACGAFLRSVEPVYTRRFTRGENRHRVPYEYIMIFEKE